jgi:hypothetical protein
MGLFGQFPGILSMAYLLQFWYFLTSSVVVVEVPHISLAHNCLHEWFVLSCCIYFFISCNWCLLYSNRLASDSKLNPLNL